jgi:hypothetical protein
MNDEPQYYTEDMSDSVLTLYHMERQVKNEWSCTCVPLYAFCTDLSFLYF